MARPARFEQATYGFEARCSIQLSYGRTGPFATFFAGLKQPPVTEETDRPRAPAGPQLRLVTAAAGSRDRSAAPHLRYHLARRGTVKYTPPLAVTPASGQVAGAGMQSMAKWRVVVVVAAYAAYLTLFLLLYPSMRTVAVFVTAPVILAAWLHGPLVAIALALLAEPLIVVLVVVLGGPFWDPAMLVADLPGIVALIAVSWVVGRLRNEMQARQRLAQQLVENEQERTASIARLASEIAHRINTPLSSIAGANSVLRRGATRADQVDLHAIISKETSRIARYISRLTRFSKEDPTSLIEDTQRALTMETTSVVFSSQDARRAGEPSSRAGRPRVLVVDSNDTICRMLNYLLDDEFSVETTTRPIEAERMIVAGERFEAIISDMTMAAMTGRQLYFAIKRVEPAQADRMIFMSGDARDPADSEFWETTTNPKLNKPFDADELRDLVRQMCDLPAQAKTSS